MTMSFDGLTKLSEECGELQQIVAKKIAFFNVDKHPDGGPSMKKRLEDEIADVLAAIGLVSDNLGLDSDRIMKRAEKKRTLFRKWHSDPNV